MCRPRMWGKPSADIFLFSAALLGVFLVSHYSVVRCCNFVLMFSFPATSLRP